MISENLIQRVKTGEIVARGFLLKKSSGLWKRWQRRQCLVKGNILTISHVTSNEESVDINLLTCQVKPSPTDRKCFDLISPNRTYHFQAEDEQKSVMWMSVLSNHQNDSESAITTEPLRQQESTETADEDNSTSSNNLCGLLLQTFCPWETILSNNTKGTITGFFSSVLKEITRPVTSDTSACDSHAQVSQPQQERQLQTEEREDQQQVRSEELQTKPESVPEKSKNSEPDKSRTELTNPKVPEPDCTRIHAVATKIQKPRRTARRPVGKFPVKRQNRKAVQKKQPAVFQQCDSDVITLRQQVTELKEKQNAVQELEVIIEKCKSDIMILSQQITELQEKKNTVQDEDIKFKDSEILKQETVHGKQQAFIEKYECILLLKQQAAELQEKQKTFLEEQENMNIMLRLITTMDPNIIVIDPDIPKVHWSKNQLLQESKNQQSVKEELQRLECKCDECILRWQAAKIAKIKEMHKKVQHHQNVLQTRLRSLMSHYSDIMVIESGFPIQPTIGQEQEAIIQKRKCDVITLRQQVAEFQKNPVSEEEQKVISKNGQIDLVVLTQQLQGKDKSLLEEMEEMMLLIRICNLNLD